MDHRADSATASPGLAPPDIDEAPASAVRTPLCFVVDDEPSIRHFLSLILHGAGVDTEEIVDGSAMRKAIERRTPDLIFLSVRFVTS
jgi:PleD family two-component response regulator